MAEDVFKIVGSLQAGTFRVTKVVAEGGFAVVYRAHHEAFDADVALKCLKVPEGMSGDEQTTFLKQFREEAQLLFRLSAAIPSVVRPLQVGTLDTPSGAFVPFLAMEWLDGETLAEHLDARILEGKPPFELARAVKLLTPAAEALATAHRFSGPEGTISVIHRDLKPDNLFIATVSGRRVVKILDFGIAKVRNAATQMAGHRTTGAGLSAFTPGYAAPEQWLPKRFGQTGPWTDVFGLALTLVELVIGQPPLDGDVHALMGAAMDPERRPTPRAEGVATSDDVEKVMCQALAVDPRDRYADIGSFWRDLQRAVGQVPARPVPRGVDSVPPPAGPAAKAATLSSLPPDPSAPTLVRGGPPLPEPAAPIDLDPGPTPGGPEAPGGAPALPGLMGNGPPESSLPLSGPGSRDGGYRSAGYPKGDLAGVGISPGPGRVPRRPEPARAIDARPLAPPDRPLIERVWAPLQLMAFASAIKLAEFLIESYLGHPIDVAGFRLIWLYGPFFVLGLVLFVVGIFSSG